MEKTTTMKIWMAFFALFVLVSGAVIALPTGGNITTDGLFTVHTFFTNGTFQSLETLNNVSCLLVGPGGAGGFSNGGGGGGGGVIHNTSCTITANNYSVVVGFPGARATSVSRVGGIAQNSSFNGMTAVGGGYGGAYNTSCALNASIGGSGGGASVSPDTVNCGFGKAGISGQGYGGFISPISDSGDYVGTGGGGAGGNGTHPNGGACLANSINGSSACYAGGGGGGGNTGTAGIGGGSGLSGGNGGLGLFPAGDGTNGLGGGGGSGGNGGSTSGIGGKGVVIIRYLTPIIPSNITNASTYVVNNQSLFANQTLLQAAFIAQTNESVSSITVFYSWLKNGANQTGLAGNLTVQNNTLSYANTTAPSFTAGDNWMIVAQPRYANNSAAPTSNSTNATVQTYSVGLVYTDSQLDTLGYSYTAYAPLNATITNNNAVFTLNGTAYSVSKATNATNNTFLSSAINLPVGTHAAIWSFNFTTSDGNILQENFTYSITVSAAGLFLCNATINTTSVVYTFYDATTLASLNATLTAAYGIGSATTIAALTNTTVSVCATPVNASFNATATENANLTGYASYSGIVALTEYNSTVQHRQIGLVNTSAGTYYTLQVQNVYSSAIAGAQIVSVHLLSNGTWISTGTQITDSTGSVVYFLVPATLYNFTVSAAGYNSLNFSLTPGATTTITIQLTQNNTVVPTTFSVWNDTSYSYSPTPGFYNSTQTLSFTVASTNSSLDAWGMYIFKVNGSNISVVFNQTSIVATGGTMSYSANPSSNYVVYPWFNHAGAANYTIQPLYYSLSNQSAGLAGATSLLATGTVISGWAYLFLAIVLSVVAGIGLYKFGSGASTVGALAVLDVMTVIAPASMVIPAGAGIEVPMWVASLLLNIGALAVLYLTSGV